MDRHLLTILLALTFAASPAATAQIREWSYPETTMQYLPAVAGLGLDFVGVKAENCFVDRTITMGISIATEIVLVNCILKNAVKEQRPDGTAWNSFPSGHTATAFLGAEIVRQEYGWGWGAGAYAVATSVGVLRAVHNRHWWWDSLAGAGAGILSANVGYLLRDPFKRLFGIKTKTNLQLALSPAADPYTGALCANLSIRF